MKAGLESMQAERDSALLERDALKRERESLQAGRDEMLQTNDRLLGRDLLFQYFSLALERTIQVVQARLEEAELKVPTTF
ncbi:hypothetical protein LIER_32198 [Lithospermum erythrorhizon]|uniref:Uncharacterized protein n=1 Tax=Lithospermum erythrorhizon TaxID=34254 RepID=A0AAV3RWM2_LITER